MEEGASTGIPVSATTPKSFPFRYAATPGSETRRDPGLPEPLCSPIGHTGDEFPTSPRGEPTPSPATKRFMGVSSNARNDIYLKTLLNSPYHKTYVPMMPSTPSYSQAYQTPGRTESQAQSPRPGIASTPQGFRQVQSPKPGIATTPQGFRKVQSPKPGMTMSPKPGITLTPQGFRQPGSGRKFVTPKNMIMNPFDNGLDDLHLPAYMSPGLFAVSSTPASEEKRAFRWDIEHIAELNPVDIPLDGLPRQHSSMIPDPETEERAQRAIEKFFASNLIAPSPWSDPKQRKMKKTSVMATPSSQADKEEMMSELQGSIQKSLPPKQGMQDASCQTVLTLPVNFDIQKVLGAYMTQDTHEDGNQQDFLSTSSLRRKLFFHGDTSSLAPSPVKGSGYDGGKSEQMSPKLNPDWNATTPLRNTPAFSSSPIKKGTTPQHRRCSSDPEFIASPELSPIVDRTKPHSKKISNSRSSGMFEPSPSSFCISPIHDLDDAAQHGIVSPIPFEGISPEGAVSGMAQPKFVDSPGFSPIRPPKTPIRKIMRRSQEESYLQDEPPESDEDSGPITPVTVNSANSNNSHTPVDYLSPIHKTPKQRTSTFILKSFSCTDLEHTAMDFECSAKPKVTRFPGDIMTSSMCETRDFSSDMDYPDETQHRTSLSNQDTGYQTASLQLTNPESVSLHTNLTNQFSSLPFNSTNQDLAFQTSHLSAGQDSRPVAPVFNLTQQMKSLKSREEVKRESPNTSVSKQLFPNEDKIAKNLFSSLEDSDSEETPDSKTNNNRMRFNFNDDSALPDESVNFKQELPFSRFKIGGQTSDFQEEEVISRAKQALAMASSFYPKDKFSGGDGDVDSMDYAMSSPQKHVGSAIKTEQPASELAFQVLQRAGEDLAKFDQFFSGQKNNNG